MHFSLKRIAFTIMLAVCCLMIQAQPLEYNQRTEDSILRALPTAKDDTNKVMGMLTLAAMNLQRFDSAKVMHWANEARALSEKLDYRLGVLLSIGQKAFYHSVTSNWPVASQEINEGMRLSEGKDQAFRRFFYNLRVIIANTRENYADAKYWAMMSLNDPDFNKEGVMGRWPTYMQLGIIYDNLEMIDSASYYAEKCREMMKMAKFRDLELNSWMVIGNVARKRKQFDEALAAYRHYPELAIGMAKTHSAMGVADSALHYGKIALDIAQRTNIPQGIMAASDFLSKEYEKTNPALSLNYLKLYASTRDQSFNAEKLKTLEALQLNEQQAQFDAAQKEVKSRNQLIQLSLLGLAVLLLSSALFLYRVSAVRKTNNEKLTKAYDELKQTQQKLIHAEKMASLGELTAGIAHEIQNPLNFVNNFAELNAELIAEIQDNKDALPVSLELKDLSANTAKIIHHGKRAEAIVKSMLQHSNTRSGEVSDVPLNVLVEDTLKKVAQSFQKEIQEYQIQVRLERDPEVQLVKAVPQEISVALANLLNNALQAVIEQSKNSSSYQGQVELRTQAGKGEALIIVTDNGPGIASANLQKIFQPFFTTKPTGQGTGLGLSLAYDMIKAQGGNVEVTNNETGGAQFTVRLPV